MNVSMGCTVTTVMRDVQHSVSTEHVTNTMTVVLLITVNMICLGLHVSKISGNECSESVNQVVKCCSIRE